MQARKSPQTVVGMSDSRADTPTDSTGSLKEDRELIPTANGSMTALDIGDSDSQSDINAKSAKYDGHGREHDKVSLYVWFITGMISISGLLFGLDTGIICASGSRRLSLPHPSNYANSWYPCQCWR